MPKEAYLKFSGRDGAADMGSSMYNSMYGTGKTSPYPNCRVTAEGGITSSRMHVREARERQQEAQIEYELQRIEQKMKLC